MEWRTTEDPSATGLVRDHLKDDAGCLGNENAAGKEEQEFMSNADGQKTDGRVPIVVDKLEWPGPINVDNFNFILK